MRTESARPSWKGGVYPLITAGLVIVGGALGLGWTYFSPAPAQRSAHAALKTVKSRPTAVDVTPVSTTTVKATTDETYRQLIVGRWETERHGGRRVMTVSEDGTAVVRVKVTGTWSYVLGDEITLNLKWQIEEGSLKFQTTGGTPEASVNVLTSLYGNERNQPILILDEKTLRVPDDEPEDPDHIWTRLPDSPTAK